MLSELRTTLLDSSQPDSARSHAAFQLRTEGSYEAYTYVLEGLRQRENDPLLRHELAYIIGQMQHKDAWRALQLILEDESDEVIVRHECAEAIGALGVPDSLSVLEAFSSHHEKDIAETCQIAVDQIKCKIEEEASRISVFGGSPLVPLDSVTTKPNPYLSVDPAPPLPGNLSIQELRERLMDTSSSLFNRYRAMFSLRNLDSDASALALLDGFADKSPLFRHEVAFVLGQMQRACTAEGLSTVLRNTAEHEMVRHEAAEALGSIGGPEIETLLEQFQGDSAQLVAQSCQVALQINDYWKEFSVGASSTSQTTDEVVT